MRVCQDRNPLADRSAQRDKTMAPATAPDSRWLLPAADPLFILAMDHRASFAKTVFGVTGEPTDAEVARMREAKLLIYEALCRRSADDFLKDAPVCWSTSISAPRWPRQAQAEGFILAMPIEKSGAGLFELEYGDRFAEHVEAFDPDYFKVLVRYNPADDEEDRAHQIESLARVSDWAHRGRTALAFRAPRPADERTVGTEATISTTTIGRSVPT